MTDTPFKSQEENIYGSNMHLPSSNVSSQINDVEFFARPSPSVTSSYNILHPLMSSIREVIRITEDNEDGHEKLKQYKGLHL
jgi:hypothetical protein